MLLIQVALLRAGDGGEVVPHQIGEEDYATYA